MHVDVSHCDEISTDLAGLILEFRRRFETLTVMVTSVDIKVKIIHYVVRLSESLCVCFSS